MAFARSNAFNADMNQDLLALIESFQYEPYGVRATSGYRPGDSRQHGRGNALDLELLDQQGNALENYQDPSTFGAYQQYANALYQHALQANPELANKLRWGGYFSGGKDTYGALDLMHFDVAGDQIGMGGGSWAGGLNPEQAKLWGLQAGGGVGGGAIGWDTNDPQQQWMSSLWADAQRVAQQTGLDPRLIMAQSALETGYGKHVPNMNYFGIKGGSGEPVETTEIINGKPVRVMDRFQGYKTAAESFDAYAKFMMGDRYKATREAKGLEAQAAALGQSGYATDPDYATKLLKIAQGIPGGAAPAAGAPGSEGSTVNPSGSLKDAVVAAKADDKNKMDKYQEAASGAMDVFANMKAPTMSNLPQMPQQAPLPMDSMPIVAEGGAAGGGRDNLAALMAQLNSGRLF